MTDPRDVPSAFDRIADKAEPLFIRLGRAAPGAELETIRNEITSLLDGAGLRWNDLAARVAAPMPSNPGAAFPPPPPPPIEEPTPAGPISPEKSLSAEELERYGYRSRGPGLGYKNADPDIGTSEPD